MAGIGLMESLMIISCEESLSHWLDSGQNALFLGDLQQAQRAATLAELTLFCGHEVHHQDLGELYLLQGYTYWLTNQEIMKHYLQLSVNMQYWNPMYGTEFEQVRQQIPPSSAYVIQSLSCKDEIWVDGERLLTEQSPNYFHLFQIHSLSLSQEDHFFVGNYDDLYTICLDNSSDSQESIALSNLQSEKIRKIMIWGMIAIGGSTVAQISNLKQMDAQNLEALAFWHFQKWVFGGISVIGFWNLFWQISDLNYQSSDENQLGIKGPF